MHIPYTYLITHIPTGVKYYGVRYARNCHPSELGISYYSSSTVIKTMIKEEGLSNFKFQVRKTFSSRNEAVKWETKFLHKVDAANSPHWFNKCNGASDFIKGNKVSETTRAKMKKPKSPIHKQKLHKHLDNVRKIPIYDQERKELYSARFKGENNPNYGKSDHAGAVALSNISRQRKGKTREEIYGKEKAKEIKEKIKINMPSKRNLKEKICPHCNVAGKGGNMTRYHFDNCKTLLI